ncbi:gluconokinase [Parapedobacter koreensis]|uniref:Gluconate kinase, FGGY family n=1 Tax=Parapedobacter koreensis TaxID=332977 RepID=A0A1H7NUB6_9SPHI|nr:gluconokinase [Parapedobacter koreensis]SEL27072.1 gluconate kinase, FGGY family [Parapedobacter koreensis]
MDYIIGVDIGTSGTKAVAFSTGGEVIAEHRITYSILNPQPGYFEQDPETLFTAVVQSISGVVQAVGDAFAESRVLGVGFSSAMHGLIVMDEGNRLLTNCIIWADTRSEAFATQLKATATGLDIYLKTGTPIHPMAPLSKLGWMREHLPAVFNRASKFISIKEYVFFKLFGCYVVDESIASATGLLDIEQLDWYAPALALVGVSATQLSALVPITHTLVGLDKQAAADMCLPVDTPFTVGGSDGCLANLGAHAVMPGDAAVTIGTSGAIRMMSGLPKTDRQARTFSYVLTKDLFVLGGAVNNGGVVLRWYNDNFGSTGKAEEEGYQRLAEEAATVAAGAEGLVFLPYLTGERAPHWDANAKGLFFGVQLHHRKAHFTRAVFEGIVYGVYSVGKVLEEIAGPIHVIHANGGFARSSWWVQLLADVFNKPVLVKENVEGAAKGAFIVALKALGMIADFKDIMEDTVIASYQPDLRNHQRYQENFNLFERLYSRVKDEFLSLT